MANFLFCIDPDPDRLAGFFDKAARLLPVVEGLDKQQTTIGDCGIAWASAHCAPVRQVSDTGGIAVVWGNALDVTGPALSASAIRRRWSGDRPEPCDGFYAAVVHEPVYGVTVGADLLGLFPIYYWSNDLVLIVASSIEVIREHPEVNRTLNPRGLVGILLTNGLVENQTLYSGISRLPAGHLLRWKSGAPPKLIQQYSPPAPSIESHTSASDQVAEIDDALRRAVQRHTQNADSCGLLLSGGRDSRMLAGYLAQQGSRVRALTFGQPTDFDMVCAQRVATVAGFEHRKHEVPLDAYTDGAKLLVTSDQLASGFTNVVDWVGLPRVAELGDSVVIGALADSIVGGSFMDEVSRTPTDTPSFESVFASMNRRGIDPEIVRGLLRNDVFPEDLVSEVIETLKISYQNLGDQEAQRAYLFSLQHRERFHVGSMAWACSFWSWPVVPVMDRAVLQAVGRASIETLRQRRAQDALIVGRFPSLARLPLDRGGYATTPLLPGFRHRMISKLRRLSRRPDHPKDPILERRYYNRIWNPNIAGWRSVREAAEAHRTKAQEYFNSDALDACLPGVDQDIPDDNPILASGVKTLIGLLLWFGDHP